jgi:hypothetical protein
LCGRRRERGLGSGKRGGRGRPEQAVAKKKNPYIYFLAFLALEVVEVGQHVKGRQQIVLEKKS